MLPEELLFGESPARNLNMKHTLTFQRGPFGQMQTDPNLNESLLYMSLGLMAGVLFLSTYSVQRRVSREGT